MVRQIARRAYGRRGLAWQDILSRRARQWFWPRVLLVFIVVVIPLCVIVFTAPSWMSSCPTYQWPFLSKLSEANCERLLAAIVVLAATGAFGLLALPLLWRGSGLMSIFEAPWFGVGEDVESTGTVESVVRAAVLIGFFWLCLGMTVLAGFAIWTVITTPTVQVNAPPQGSDAPKPSDRSIASILEAMQGLNPKLDDLNTKIDKLAQPAPALDQLNRKLDDLNTKIDRYAQQVAALDQLQPKFGDWSRETVAAPINSLGREVQGLSRRLDAVKTELNKYDQRLAKLDDIQSRLNEWDPKTETPWSETVALMLRQIHGLSSNLERVSKQLARQEQHLVILNYVYQALVDKDPAAGSCFDVEFSAEADTGPAASDPNARRSPSGASLGRYRSVAMRPVLFDKDSHDLSSLAQQILLWFLMEAGPTSAILIHGSTDPQGGKERNYKLAQDRVEAVKRFIQERARSVRVAQITAESTFGTPQSEPYKRITAVWLLQPCQ